MCNHKEIEMTTNQPVDLGKASEETKQIGHGDGDGPVNPFAERLA
jgi:hypothetical protein